MATPALLRMCVGIAQDYVLLYCLPSSLVYIHTPQTTFLGQPSLATVVVFPEKGEWRHRYETVLSRKNNNDVCRNADLRAEKRPFAVRYEAKCEGVRLAVGCTFIFHLTPKYIALLAGLCEKFIWEVSTALIPRRIIHHTQTHKKSPAIEPFFFFASFDITIFFSVHCFSQTKRYPYLTHHTHTH